MTVLLGDCRKVLPTLSDTSVRCVVTSPPYFGLRDYGVDGQIGLERTISDFVSELVTVFREVRRVLADDGTLWLNLGDSYASTSPGGTQGQPGLRSDRRFTMQRMPARGVYDGLAEKNLLMIPARVALALQADGWILRRDIIWHRTNPMPESARDRCTTSHEYLFHFSKQTRYYYDAAAIAEPAVTTRWARVDGWASGSGKHDAVAHSRRARSADPEATIEGSLTRNRRSVWTIPTAPYSDAHFATFPEALVEPCILAGSEPGDTVLDPFAGSGTTLGVAQRLGRVPLGIELNPDYLPMIYHRLTQQAMVLRGEIG